MFFYGFARAFFGARAPNARLFLLRSEPKVVKPKMTYWLCITNEENWQVVKQRNVWGVAERHRNTIAKVILGDTLLMYLKQEKLVTRLKNQGSRASSRQHLRFTPIRARYLAHRRAWATNCSRFGLGSSPLTSSRSLWRSSRSFPGYSS